MGIITGGRGSPQGTSASRPHEGTVSGLGLAACRTACGPATARTSTFLAAPLVLCVLLLAPARATAQASINVHELFKGIKAIERRLHRASVHKDRTFRKETAVAEAMIDARRDDAAVGTKLVPALLFECGTSYVEDLPGCIPGQSALPEVTRREALFRCGRYYAHQGQLELAAAFARPLADKDRTCDESRLLVSEISLRVTPGNDGQTSKVLQGLPLECLLTGPEAVRQARAIVAAAATIGRSREGGRGAGRGAGRRAGRGDAGGRRASGDGGDGVGLGPERAMDFAQVGVLARPRDPDAWTTLGDACTAAGRPAQARDAYRAALRAQPAGSNMELTPAPDRRQAAPRPGEISAGVVSDAGAGHSPRGGVPW